MNPQIIDKITQYIKSVSYLDVKDNMYSEKNDFQMIAPLFARLAKIPQDYNTKPEDVISESGYIGVAWEIGGQTGGNCWGNSAEPYTVESPQVRDFYLLDEIFSNLLPDLKHKDFIKIMADLPITTTTTSASEYYGNYTEYYVKYFAVADLVNGIAKLDIKIDEQLLDHLNEQMELRRNSKNIKMKK